VTNQIAHFEQLVERLVEGSLSRLFAGRLHAPEIVAQLARALEDNAQEGQAPDRFWIYLYPGDRESLLEAEPALERLLAEQVLQLARMADLDLASDPIVELIPRPGVSPGSIVVSATGGDRSDQQTRTLDPGTLHTKPGPESDDENYLIVDGQRHIPLTQPICTLGRGLDCDVVLSDPRVSRRHAQLRWRFGRHVLYDLGSSGGTTVNGRAITEAALDPGDVFSLGGADIIYGRDPQDVAPRSERDTPSGWAGSTRASDAQ